LKGGEKVNKRFTIPSKFSLADEFSVDNPNFHPVKIRIMSSGKNYNGSDFVINSLDKAKDTISYSPILANIVERDDGELDFNGHDVNMEMNVDYNGNVTIKEKYIEYPVGVFINNSAEKIYDEEHDVYFLQAQGFLWKTYNEAYEILKRDEVKDVSMEIEVNQGAFREEDGFYEIHDFNILGVTLLGNGNLPAIEHSKIEFSVKQNKEYEENLNELKKLLENFNRKEVNLVEENKNFETEEVVETPNEVEEQVEFSEEVVEEQVEFAEEEEKEEEVCSECGKNPCECEEEKEEEFATCPDCGKDPCECKKEEKCSVEEEEKEEPQEEEKKYTQSEVDEMIANTRNEFATVLEELACLREFKAEYDRNVALKELNDKMDALLVNFNVDENIVNELREKVIAEEITLEKFELELYRNNKVVAKKEEFNKKALPISDAKEHKMSEIDMLFARYGINKK
jgi:hypothetical protein